LCACVHVCVHVCMHACVHGEANALSRLVVLGSLWNFRFRDLSP